MKKAFTFMEVIIATILLSVVMISLLQIKSNNIFLVEKSNEKNDSKEYLNLAISLKNESTRNTKIKLDDIYYVNNSDIRRELKQQKIKVKSNKIETMNMGTEDFPVVVDVFENEYEHESKMKKNIYFFQLQL